jgi:hypothetical protein
MGNGSVAKPSSRTRKDSWGKEYSDYTALVNSSLPGGRLNNSSPTRLLRCALLHAVLPSHAADTLQHGRMIVCWESQFCGNQQ